MTCWANLQTLLVSLRDTLRCDLPNLFLALALFLLPFSVLDRRRCSFLILRSSFLRNLGLSTLEPKLSVEK